MARSWNKGRPYVPREKVFVERACAVCGGPFTANAAYSRRFCSDVCRHRLQRFRKYGLSTDSYLSLLAQQGDRCAACGVEFAADEIPRVDHCHKSGRVRGLLHNNCNIGLGHAKDDPEVLRRWIAYLEAGSTRVELAA